MRGIKQTARKVGKLLLRVAAARACSLFGLTEKATEKQYAQNHYDSDYDDLDQAHSKFLKVRTKSG